MWFLLTCLLYNVTISGGKSAINHTVGCEVLHSQKCSIKHEIDMKYFLLAEFATYLPIHNSLVIVIKAKLNSELYWIKQKMEIITLNGNHILSLLCMYAWQNLGILLCQSLVCTRQHPQNHQSQVVIAKNCFRPRSRLFSFFLSFFSFTYCHQ